LNSRANINFVKNKNLPSISKHVQTVSSKVRRINSELLEEMMIKPKHIESSDTINQLVIKKDEISMQTSATKE